MKAATQLNLVANLPILRSKTLHNQSNAQAGYDLPVSKFAGYEDGTLPAGTAKYENAVLIVRFQNGYQKTVSNVTNVPSYVHHATIRPILATEAEVAAAPEHFDTIPALGAKDLQFRIAVSPLDCLGSR